MDMVDGNDVEGLTTRTPRTDSAMSANRASTESRAPTLVGDAAVAFGDWILFSLRAISGVMSRHMKPIEVLRAAVEIGAGSVGVVMITGAFIGMVLAVQAYGQFHQLGLDTSLGAVIHMSVVRELGPVLAAVMLAGRVGSAMAAQLATMRITEQIDALSCLGVDPVKFLVAPRFLACVLTAPLLAAFADVLGLVGSSVICLQVYGIDSYHYWRHAREYIGLWDVGVGLAKAVIFAGVSCLIACHRGFHARAGAAGVGRAATEAFVVSFVAILALDFVLAMFANAAYAALFSSSGAKVL
jgi:phospholipid/cholesterol/gamma-HCH transport system permease protein